MHHLARFLVWVFLGCALSACFGSPTPLAPSIKGSVGVPHQGVLSGGTALPQKGPGYERLRTDAIRWGNPRLVAALKRAAARVAQQRPGGAPLMIGDLSAKRGGQIPKHRSHRNGRDADLLFYVLSPDGRPLPNPEFLRFGRDGLGRSIRNRRVFVRLDTERNWLLVKALVNDEQAQVQWLFMARWLEALLIEYARARGEDDELLWRAANLMHQPGDSFPHDDHIHMRIACAPQEAVEGCLRGGYRWPWLPPLPQPPKESDDALLAALFADQSDGEAATEP